MWMKEIQTDFRDHCQKGKTSYMTFFWVRTIQIEACDLALSNQRATAYQIVVADLDPTIFKGVNWGQSPELAKFKAWDVASLTWRRLKPTPREVRVRSHVARGDHSCRKRSVRDTS